MTRRAFDFYETPPWQTRALLRRVPVCGRVFECCVGDGSLARELYRTGRIGVVTNDIDFNRTADYHLDATQPSVWDLVGAVDWVVTNPPFTVADRILPRALAVARVGVVLLGRLSFLEPTQERDALWQAHPPTGQIVLPRWSYKANGKSDSVTTAWFLWKLRLAEPIQVVARAEKVDRIAEAPCAC